MRILSAMAGACQELFWRSLPWLYFNRLTMIHPERLPARGPTFFLGLHRNGAIDGFVYHRVVPRAVFMISAQLRRSALGRLFFAGIEVVRDKDGTPEERARNRASLEQCHELLSGAGELFVLPEGTSDLGPRHLPFRRGAARIAESFLASGSSLNVVPLGIHYERAWAFRSNVEVVVGEPIDVRLPQASVEERVALLHERFSAALEGVGFNVSSVEEQTVAEQLAYAATLGTGRSYFAALKALERGVPEGVASARQRLEEKCANLALLRHQGVPLLPISSVWPYVLALAVLGPLVVAAALINLPPLVAAGLASAKLADARNVIALWRILVGVPVLLLWVGGMALAAWLLSQPWLFGVYVVLTVAGLAAWYRAHKLAVSVYNALRGGSIKVELLELHQRLDQALSHGR
jgi:1-acyl-sn-glycerol-3-phosphate acyltransferase